MLVRLQKLDDGIGLRLPSELCEQLGLTPGSTVGLRVEQGRIVLSPSRLTLAEVLEGFTPEDWPGEVDWGPPVGREVW